MGRLPEPPGAEASGAEGVNGDIVGSVETAVDGGSYLQPVVWPADRPGTVATVTGLPAARAVVTIAGRRWSMPVGRRWSIPVGRDEPTVWTCR